MGWILYQVAIATILVVAAPFLLLTRGRHYLETLPGRLGRGEKPDDAVIHGGLWIHAVSVGEVAVAATLVRALPETLPLVVTTVTPTGQHQARKAFAERRRAGHATVAYLPFDFRFAVSRFFKRFSPRALVLIEGDYWPLTLHYMAQRKMPMAVVNGRVSHRSFSRLRRLGRWNNRLFFDSVHNFGVQTGDDHQRLLDLGVAPERVLTTGNLKFDSPKPEPLARLEGTLEHLAGTRPILLAGSTMKDEEEPILDAFAHIGQGERALLVLVPRHPERWDAVARLLDERGLRWIRRSTLDTGTTDTTLDTAHYEAVLLDSLGELAALYAIATVAFIGGTLVPTGGHNPLEPARFAVPIVVGPSMENFREISDTFNNNKAWHQVADAEGLAEVWDTWLESGVTPSQEAVEVGRRGDELLRSNQGALRRTLEMLEPILSRIPRESENQNS